MLSPPTGESGRELAQMLQNIDRTPPMVYPAAGGGGQDTALIDWSPLAKAGGSWELLHDLVRDPGCAAAVGALLGMAIGDALGAPLEFLPVNPALDYGDARNSKRPCVLPTLQRGELLYIRAHNKFSMLPGQWTDDTSMALCLADSLLVCGGYNGGDTRVRFHMWWEHSYCNCFRHDRERPRPTSVGLGGNISTSLKALERIVSRGHGNHADIVPPIYDSTSEDAGNGSIMRLAPVPIAFHANEAMALEVAEEQSLATHPSSDASACCRFMTFFIIHAIAAHRAGREPQRDTRGFIDDRIRDFLAFPLGATSRCARGHEKLCSLLQCRPPSAAEMHWNWKADILGINEAIHARRSGPGGKYNGYPVLPGYFGSYCMDGLAMALWSLWFSKDFESCVICAANLLGDADTVAAIAGQMAGALYGFHGIVDTPVGNLGLRNLSIWDPLAEVGLRAALLYHHGPSSATTADVCVTEKLHPGYGATHSPESHRLFAAGNPVLPMPTNNSVLMPPEANTSPSSQTKPPRSQAKSPRSQAKSPRPSPRTASAQRPKSPRPSAPAQNARPQAPPVDNSRSNLSNNVPYRNPSAGLGSYAADQPLPAPRPLADPANLNADMSYPSRSTGPSSSAPVFLKQAEGHATVRVFDNPSSTANVVKNVPNGERMTKGTQHGSFVEVTSRRGSKGWVGVKNIATPGATSGSL